MTMLRNMLMSRASGVGSIFAPLLYTGTSAPRSFTGVGFQPDLVWAKNRDDVFNHYLYDSTRGVHLSVRSNAVVAESTDTNSITSFDADGFTIGNFNGFNNLNDKHVAWCFKKDEEAFDIVPYTGTGSAHTEAHNMTVAPEMVFIKDLDAGQDWQVGHKDLNTGVGAWSRRLVLNSTSAEGVNVGAFNSTAPTSSVFTVGSGGDVNTLNNNYIAYLFASKAGVSKVGAYSGTGISGNAITGLGFAPRFVMIKNRTFAASWAIHDDARGGSAQLLADTSGAEVTNNLSFDSDGFTINNTSARTNTSGTDNYIYLALA